VSTEVIKRQAPSNLIRRSRSREPIMTNDSTSLRSRVDVGARLTGIEHRREVPLSPTVRCWPRSGNFVKRLRSCVGMSRLLEWFLLFLATMISSQISSGQVLGGILRARPILQRNPRGVQGIHRIIYSMLFFDIAPAD
jgi:hypothetical protein